MYQLDGYSQELITVTVSANPIWLTSSHFVFHTVQCNEIDAGLVAIRQRYLLLSITYTRYIDQHMPTTQVLERYRKSHPLCLLEAASSPEG